MAAVLLACAAIVCLGVSSQPSHAEGIVDEFIFNADTNVLAEGDDFPGETIATSITSSPPLFFNGTFDTVEDFFGNNNGNVEPRGFIFEDLDGVADNGNQIVGDDDETVDFVQWSTHVPIELSGMQIQLQADFDLGDRGTQLVRIFVEGVEVALFDNDGLQRSVDVNFPPVVGNDFRVEFTREVGGRGERVSRIDALDASISAISGDYDSDGDTDGADFLIWQQTLGSTSDLRADGDGSGTIDAGDLTTWGILYGSTTTGSPLTGLVTIPEPATCFLMLIGMVCLGRVERVRKD